MRLLHVAQQGSKWPPGNEGRATAQASSPLQSGKCERQLGRAGLIGSVFVAEAGPTWIVGENRYSRGVMQRLRRPCGGSRGVVGVRHRTARSSLGAWKWIPWWTRPRPDLFLLWCNWVPSTHDLTKLPSMEIQIRLEMELSTGRESCCRHCQTCLRRNRTPCSAPWRASRCAN